ncbi:protein FMC1 homolog isoform X2 [Gadus morhua]|uniref:Protein FMC1 homolog n=1 Tax=Gadus morhua TaxID=8049 RepID=A0A8C5B5C1_GADMO|nr:protein FMC1 homolog isoform X2 [Gadus morhua]
MSGLSPSLRVFRGLLKELREIHGTTYKNTLAYNYVIDQFRKNGVTGERQCRARQEALHLSQAYLCLLRSTREHLALHKLYHGKGDRGLAEMASLVGLRLPSQPGGKGWEE